MKDEAGRLLDSRVCDDRGFSLFMLFASDLAAAVVVVIVSLWVEPLMAGRERRDLFVQLAFKLFAVGLLIGRLFFQYDLVAWTRCRYPDIGLWVFILGFGFTQIFMSLGALERRGKSLSKGGSAVLRFGRQLQQISGVQRGR